MNKDYDFRDYTISISRLDEDDGEGWCAKVEELTGCIAAGDTVEEALALLEDALDAWLWAASEDGAPVPPPRTNKKYDYSGKFTLRIPKSLHAFLAQQADQENVSLNQYVLSLLAYNAGSKSTVIKNPPWEEEALSGRMTVEIDGPMDMFQRYSVGSEGYSIVREDKEAYECLKYQIE